MKASFKPRVEMLEDRQLLNADLTSLAIEPVAKSSGTSIATLSDFVVGSFPAYQPVSGRVTAIAVDPTDAVPDRGVPADGLYDIVSSIYES